MLVLVLLPDPDSQVTSIRLKSKSVNSKLSAVKMLSKGKSEVIHVAAPCH